MKSSKELFALIEDYALLNYIEEWRLRIERGYIPQQNETAFGNIAAVFNKPETLVAARYLELTTPNSEAWKRLRTIESRLQIAQWRINAQIERSAKQAIHQIDLRFASFRLQEKKRDKIEKKLGPL